MTDLEKHFRKVLTDFAGRTLHENDKPAVEVKMTPLVNDAAQNLKAAFIEWAEGCVPPERSWDKKDADSLNANQARAFNSCRTQTINNIRGKQ